MSESQYSLEKSPAPKVESSSEVVQVDDDVKPNVSGLKVIHERPELEDEPETKRLKQEYQGNYENKSEVAHFKPPLIPFKIFVQSLDDFISEEDAVSTYQTYKFDLNKKHIKDFFDLHKDEEWLQKKYHPDFIENSKEATQKILKTRLDAFLDLFEKGYVDSQSVQLDNQKNIKTLFDAVMLKLSRGSDQDLLSLWEKNTVKEDPETSEVVENGEESLQDNQSKFDELFNYETICFKNLPSCVVKADLEEECRKKEGFLRFAMTQPALEKRLTRIAWATYKAGVPIKKYCWDLNSCPLIRNKLYTISKDLVVSVYRGNHQRILPISSISMHKDVMRSDLIYAATIVAKLDAKYDLWAQNNSENNGDEYDEIGTNTQEELSWMPGVLSSNPLLKSVNDYMKPDDESAANKYANEETSIELSFDPNMARVLDLLIFYLRIVHSFDFYSVSFFHDEENMPHKCSAIHVRGDRTIRYENSQPLMTFKAKEMIDYQTHFKKRIEDLINQEFNTSEEVKYEKIGPRNQEEAKKAFIESNILKKISKKKPFKVVWMCPFSDKKFREPVYVEKHILNKHLDKVEAVLKEVTYFNNYLRDPYRPSQPDAPRHVIEQTFSKEFAKFSDSKPNFRNNMSPRVGGGRFNRNNFHRFNNNNNNHDGEKNHQQALAAVSSVASSINSHNPSEILQKALNMINGNQRNYHHRPYHNNQNNGNNNPGRRGRDFGNRYANQPSAKDRRMVSYNDLDTPNES